MKEKDLVEIYSEGTIESDNIIGSKEDKSWAGSYVALFYINEWLPFWNPGILCIEQVPSIYRGYLLSLDRMAQGMFKTVKEFIDSVQAERCFC